MHRAGVRQAGLFLPGATDFDRMTGETALKKALAIKVHALMLCIVLLAGLLGAGLLAGAENGYVLNGREWHAGDLGISSPDECWVYGNRFYSRIWGSYQNQNPYSFDNLLKQYHDAGNYEALKLTPENLKKYVTLSVPGAIMRICGDIGHDGRDARTGYATDYLRSTSQDGWGHTQIIVDYDENGFTVFQGGYPNYPYYEETYYTWEGYAYAVDCNEAAYNGFHKYEYIKYIKFPGGSGTPEWAPDTDLSVLNVYAATERLHMRSSPYAFTNGSNIFTTVEPGTEFYYFTESRGWAGVIYEGRLMYCSPDYITLVREYVPPETDPPETDPPETDPPETDPLETDPPETEPPETVPPETDPPETVPPETDPPETVPPETQPRPTAADAPDVPPEELTEMVTTDALRLRMQPDSSADNTFAVVPAGTTLHVYQDLGDWVSVIFEQKLVYCAKRFLTEPVRPTEPPPTEPPTPPPTEPPTT